MHSTFNFNAQNVSHFGQSWSPTGEANAVLAIVHGHGEHSSRYEHVAQFLNEKGIAVIAYDFYGHGKSEGKKGYTPTYEGLLDAVGIFLGEVKNRFPDKPTFLYGHSMGGNFVANYVLKRKPDLQGVVLSAPWLGLAFDPSKIDLTLGKMMLKLYPKFTQASKLETAALSRDLEVVRQYEADPLIHDQIGPALGFGCMDNGAWAIEHAGEWTLPILHYHGTADRITSCDASERFSSKIKGDATWKAFDGYYHELHNEPEAERALVLEMLRGWILERI
jgi:alpha-beta hydrolase superfamily lysophospholipase